MQLAPHPNPDRQPGETDSALEKHLERVAIARRQVRHGARQPGLRARPAPPWPEVQPLNGHETEAELVRQLDQQVLVEGHDKPHVEDHEGQIQDVYALLEQIQDENQRSLFSGPPCDLPGLYRIDDRIYVGEGQRSDFTWSLIDDDPLVQQLRSPIAESSRIELQQLVRHQELKHHRLFIIHQLGSRGHKEEIEASQQIPIELIEPISIREQISQERDELVKRSQPHLVALVEAIKRSAPSLAIGIGAILAVIMGVLVVVAIIQAIFTSLASLLVPVVLVAGLLGGCGTDPILIGAVDHEDGTSTLTFLTRYSYPVRRK
jgi:hypothetical protein